MNYLRISILLLPIVHCSCLMNVQDDQIKLTNLVQFFNASSSLIDNIGVNYVKQIKTIENNSNLSSICANHLIRLITNVTKELWASKMLDSNGRIPSGILSGTLTDFGDFDECIQINEPMSEDNSIIRGKYCFLTITPIPNQNIGEIENKLVNISKINWINKEVNDWLEFNKHFSFSNGLCFPSSCEPNEIKLVLGQLFPVLKHLHFDVEYCQTNGEPTTYSVQLCIALLIINTSLVLVVLGTIFDVYVSRESGVFSLLKCFSVHKNIKILFRISTEKSVNEYRLQFIHGLRVFGTIWVILAHSSGFVLTTILVKVSPFSRYPDDAIENSKTILSQYILNASLAVQIFFVMSGFLTIYSTLSKKKLEISFFEFVLLRWLRFTPPLIGMLCLTISLQIFGSGPMFQKDLLKGYLDPCSNNWWAHLLYIINWFDLRQMCGIQTWYLGADFQLHILSFVVIYFFYKNQSISFWFSYSMIIFGVTIPVLLVGIGIAGIPRVDVLFKPKYDVPGKETTLFFFGTHMHLISYFIGTILGYALLNRKFISISKGLNRLIWSITVLFCIIIPMLSYPILQEDIHPVNHDVSNSIMVSLMLTVWSLCMFWVIYNCAINRAVVLTKILSANFLHPLSRLSFCAYLTHLMLIWFNVQQIRYPITINAITIGQYFATILVETFVMSLFLYLTFEAPFVNIIKLLLKSTQNHNKRQRNEEENNHSVDSQNSINDYNLKNINNNF